MAVSKRTRFEVLRRDDYTCRYCRSKDGELTIDHVVPTALGGSDAPDNLVAACKDCNSGKSSMPADAALVADVADDALRWARALEAASEIITNESADRDQYLERFDGLWWDEMPPFAERPADWETTVWGYRKRGLPTSSIEDAVRIAAAKRDVIQRARWRYFCGVCKGMLTDLEVAARALIDRGEVT